MDISLLGFRVIVAVQVEDPICIKMGMYGHMKGVGILSDLIFRTVLIKALIIALVITSKSFVQAE